MVGATVESVPLVHSSLTLLLNTAFVRIWLLVKQETLLALLVYVCTCTYHDCSGYNFVRVSIHESPWCWSRERKCISVVVGGGFFDSFPLFGRDLRGAHRLGELKTWTRFCL